MAIAYDTNSDFGGWQAGATSKTWSHTCSGSDRILVVYVTVSPGVGSVEPTSVTYNGVSLTKLGSVAGSSSNIGLWYLLAPASGANNIVVTFASATAWYSWAQSFNGVKTIKNFNSAFVFPSTSTSLNITSSTGNLITDGLLLAANSTPSPGGGQTATYQYGSSNGQASSYKSAGSGSTNMSWTGANQAWLHIGAELEEGVQAIEATYSETITLTDTKISTAFRVLTENITNSDTFSYLKVLTKNLLETLNLTDNILRTISIVRTEVASLTDTFISATVRVRQYVESISLTDTVIRVYGKVYTEIVSLLQQIVVKFNGIVTNGWSKIAKAVDTWTKTPKN